MLGVKKSPLMCKAPVANLSPGAVGSPSGISIREMNLAGISGADAADAHGVQPVIDALQMKLDEALSTDMASWGSVRSQWWSSVPSLPSSVRRCRQRPT